MPNVGRCFVAKIPDSPSAQTNLPLITMWVGLLGQIEAQFIEDPIFLAVLPHP